MTIQAERPLDEIAMEYILLGSKAENYVHCRGLFTEMITRAGIHVTQDLINDARQTARIVGLK